MVRTLAIDASTHNSGVAVFQDGKLIHYECITATDSNVLNRIKKMVIRIKDLNNIYSPTHIVMQQVLPEDVKHNQTVYKALMYLQAAVVLKLHEQKQKVDFIHVSHWRKICGIKMSRNIKREELKNASKNLVKQIYNINVNDDISDAICLGIAYLQQHNIEIEKASAF